METAIERRDKIRSLLDRAEDLIDTAVPIILRAYALRDWEAMGYGSWESYLSQELPAVNRLKLNRPERQNLNRELAKSGLSTRAIAAVTGVTHKTVRNDLKGTELAPTGIGLDGKEYRRRPVLSNIKPRSCSPLDNARRMLRQCEVALEKETDPMMRKQFEIAKAQVDNIIHLYEALVGA